MALAALLILSICFNILPASATEIVPDNVVDLMTSIEYSVYTDGDYWYESPNISLWFNDVYNMSVRWNRTPSVRFNRVVFTILTWDLPSSLKLNGISGTLIGQQYESENRLLSQWSFPLAGVGEYLDLSASWDSSYTGDFIFLSGVGYSEIVNDITTAEIRLQGQYTTYELENHLIETLVPSKSVTLPYGYEYRDYNGYDPQLDMGYLSVFVRPEDRDLNYANSITFFITSIGPMDFEAYLTNISNSAGATSLPVTSVLESDSFGIIDINKGEMQYKQNQYSVTVDLSGYDLTDRTIVLESTVTALSFEDNTGSVSGFKYYVSGICMTPEVSEAPWYLDFANWLKKQFQSIKDTIAEWCAKIIAALDSLLGGSSEEVDQVVDNMQNAADDLQQAGDAMNSVEKPAVGDIDVSVNNVVPQSAMLAYTKPITAFWQSDLMLSFISLVTTIVLVSWVFFGKKA